jgi:hypothetical protein
MQAAHIAHARSTQTWRSADEAQALGAAGSELTKAYAVLQELASGVHDKQLGAVVGWWVTRSCPRTGKRLACVSCNSSACNSNETLPPFRNIVFVTFHPVRCRKCGATNNNAQSSLGVSGPFLAPLFANSVHTIGTGDCMAVEYAGLGAPSFKVSPTSVAVATGNKPVPTTPYIPGGGTTAHSVLTSHNKPVPTGEQRGRVRVRHEGGPAAARRRACVHGARGVRPAYARIGPPASLDS